MTPLHIPRLKFVLSIALSLFAIPSLAAQSPDNPKPRIAEVLRREQYGEALEMLHAALRAAPNDAQLLTMQGVAFRGAGDKQSALGSFQRALKFDPDNVPSLQGAAQIEYDDGSAAGIPLLEHLLRLHPDDLTSHGMLAVLEYQQGQCAAAAPHFEKALPLFESRPPALHAYAACLMKQRQLDKAAEILERSVTVNPEDAQERRLLAAVQLMEQHPAEAIATLTPLLGAKADAQTLELASQAYEQSHQTDDAVAALRQAILLDPSNVNLYVDFAALSEKHQSAQVGINVVNDGINLEHRAAALYFARGMLYVQLTEYEKAQDDFDTAYKLDPLQSLTAAAQGLIAMQQNHLDKALAGVQEKLASRPNDPILLYTQADVIGQQDPVPGTPQFETAMASAKKAVALNPALIRRPSII